MDPIELRRRNLDSRRAHPYVTGLTTAGRGPVDYDSGDYPRCMALALEALDLPAGAARAGAAACARAAISASAS